MSNSENKIIVDNIRALCKAKNTSITKLEEKLRFGNGSIGKWAKAPKSPPFAKLSLIATELNVPVASIVEKHLSLDDILLMTAIDNGMTEVVEVLREKEAAKYETEQKKIASPKGSEFLEKYSLLTPQNQALINQMLDQLSKAQSVE